MSYWQRVHPGEPVPAKDVSRRHFTTGQVHGTANSYQRYGCRCDECREVGRIETFKRRNPWASGVPKRRPMKVADESPERELERLIHQQAVEMRGGHRIHQQGMSLDRPVGERGTFGDLLLKLGGVATRLTSIGFCDRCEHASDEMKDGVCTNCWERAERRLTDQQRAIPGQHEAPREYRKPRTRVEFQLEDDELSASESETRARGRMTKREKRANDSTDWVYEPRHRARGQSKGDEADVLVGSWA